MKQSLKKRHLYDIEKLTGLAIILVVIGHLVTGQDINTPGLEWYKFLKKYIYSFHMPLFMFLSGVIFYYSLPEFKTNVDYRRYLIKKVKRLLPSYLLFSVIIFAAKLLLSKSLNIDNPVNGFEDFLTAYYAPTSSYAGFLWYVYVLMEYYIILSLLLSYIKPIWIFLVSMVLYFFQFPDIFALNFFFQMLPYFMLGCIAIKNYEVYIKYLNAYKYLFIVVFLSLSIVFYFLNVPKIVMGLASIPGLHAVILLTNVEKKTVLSILGVFSFSIYLMNTLVMGFVKSISFKLFEISYANFYLIALIMIFLGLSIPIIIKKYIINKIPYINKYIG